MRRHPIPHPLAAFCEIHDDYVKFVWVERLGDVHLETGQLHEAAVFGAGLCC